MTTAPHDGAPHDGAPHDGAPHDGAFTDGWLRRFADAARATEPELTALDQQSGDGDFGVNLNAGTTAALVRLDALDETGRGPAAGPLDAAASAFLDEVGGTSGPLFGLLLQSLAASAEAAGASDGRLTTPALAEGVAEGLAAIRRVGDAEPGDKTLVDALPPAAGALAAAGPDTPPDEALRHAAEAAWQGVRDTAGLRARQGRASYLRDRATDVPDPGAVGVALFLTSAGSTVTALTPYLSPAMS
ncbi:DAK2 domain-containing protein [Streptomyces sp. NPDC005012]|uniref:DAK2 domain-containing protein n=1 Tax=Streptomyces sp. NPDC005012 TaxID=3154558 RepID=UPI0033A18861